MSIKDRGFASMSKEERRRIAIMGGKASAKKRKERASKKIIKDIEKDTENEQ